jgi:hypothetical protein
MIECLRPEHETRHQERVFKVVPRTDKDQVRPDQTIIQQEIRTRSKRKRIPEKKRELRTGTKREKESNKRRDGGDGKKGGGGANQTMRSRK